MSKGNLILKFDVKDNGRLRENAGGALCGLNGDVTRFVVNNGIVISGCRLDTWCLGVDGGERVGIGLGGWVGKREWCGV